MSSLSSHPPSTSTPVRDPLLTWLDSAGLSKFHARFRARGVTAENFIDLQLEDYNELGVVDTQERVRLFRLKQSIKTEAEMARQTAANRRLGTHLGDLAREWKGEGRMNGNMNGSGMNNNEARIARNFISNLVAKPMVEATMDDLLNEEEDLTGVHGLGNHGITGKQRALGNEKQERQLPPPRQIAMGGPPTKSAPVLVAKPSSILHSGNNSHHAAPAIQHQQLAPAAAHPVNVSHHNTPAYPNHFPSMQKKEETYADDDEDNEELEYDEFNDDGEIEIDDSFSGKPEDRKLGIKKSKISVVVRKRPLNGKERRGGENDIVSVKSEERAIVVHEPKIKVDLTKFTNNQEFLFDEVFDTEESNYEIYRRTAQPLIDSVFKRGKATCFAYGQTGSGKTFTMMGPGSDAPFEHQGLYIQAARDIFATLAKTEHKSLCVCISFFEIYGGKLFDLLNQRNKLVAREDANQKCNVVGLTDKVVNDINQLMKYIEQGNATRSVGVTGANLDSSRSHAILQIMLNHRDTGKTHGKFSFIDLAGSERAADTANNDRQTRLEGADINQSLLALKECIRALDQGAKHLPFRQSKLTQVLKDSFVGNSRTVMIATVSPNSGACEHTLNTLRYAYRVKELKKDQQRSAAENHNAYMPHQDRNFHGPIPPQPVMNSVATASPRPVNGVTAALVQPVVHSQPPSRLPRPYASRSSSPSHLDDEDLEKTHSIVVNQIFADEEQMVDSHRRQIDETMKLVKEEMDLLRSFDKQEIVLEDYVQSLDSILSRKIKAQAELRELLAEIKVHLQQEDSLSSSLKKRNL